MLTEESYLTAIVVYCGAALLALLLMLWWLRKSWRPAWLALGFFVGAALLLTPAFPEAGSDTLAPALIVAGFQLLTDGVESAQHALRPLLFMLCLAVVLSLLLRFTVLRGRGVTSSPSEVGNTAPRAVPDKG